MKSLIMTAGLAGFVLALGGCASQLETKTPSVEISWPSASAIPRIEYAGAFSQPNDLGIRKSFFQKLKELLTDSSEAELIRPMAILVTPDNTFYVADPGAKGVHIYDTMRGKYSFVQGTDDIGMVSPVGLARSEAGFIYVTDSTLGKVFKIEPGARSASIFKTNIDLDQPTGLAFDSRGNRLLVVDTAAHSVKIFSTEGEYLGKIGERGEGDGQFNFPTLAWVDKDGKLLVLDSMNFRVQRFEQNSVYVSKMGRQGDGSGDLLLPKAVATDRNGHVYVTDALFHGFQIFDLQGNFLLSIGNQGRGAGEFWLPTGIFVTDSNLIYICDSYNRRIQMFRYVGD